MGVSEGKYVRPPGLETGDSVEMTELTRDRTLFRSNEKIPVVRKLAIMFFIVILFVQTFAKSETKQCTVTTFLDSQLCNHGKLFSTLSLMGQIFPCLVVASDVLYWVEVQIKQLYAQQPDVSYLGNSGMSVHPVKAAVVLLEGHISKSD